MDLTIAVSVGKPVDIHFLGVRDTFSALGLLNNIWRSEG